MVSDMATSTGDNLIWDASTISNYTLQQHSTEPATLNLIHQGGWDFVSLQEYSQWPSQPLSFVQQNTYPYATFLDNEINTYNPGAETIFYMTWGRRDGDETRCAVEPEVCTYIGMDDLTRQRYMIMAQDNHAIVSPVGAVWRYLRLNNPSIELYIADKSHPNVAGSYAAACSFYTAIFRKDPSGITYNSTLSTSDAAAIRNAAKLVVYDSLLTWHIGEYDLDTQAPTVPSGLSASNITQTNFTLTWAASTDNIGVTAYMVYQNGTLVTTVSGTSANISGLSAGTSYSMTVRAKDAAGNTSSPSNVLSVTTSFTPIVLTITGVLANNKVYDGTTSATLNTGSAALSGVQGGDHVNLITTSATGAFVNKNTGTLKTVTTSGFTLGGTDAGKYTLTQPTTTANISQATLSITGVTANNKVYNAATAATINTGSASLSVKYGADVVNLITTAAVGTFNNKNAGNNKTVTMSGFTISGTDSGNYTLTQPTSTANITTANLTITGVTANNKAYDGTTVTTLNTGGASLSGVFGGDGVNLITTGATGTFASPNIGTAIVVSTSGFALGGADAANYSLTQPVTTANITGIALTIAGVTANNKVYNGTTSATLNTGSAILVGVSGGDAVSLVSTGAAGTFINKNAGTSKTVTTTGFTLSGADAVKYTLTQPTATANITQASITVTGLTANNKVYNGTTTASLNTGTSSLSGVIGGDAVNLVTTGASGTFVTKNAGNNITVTTSGFTITGSDSGNYTLTQPSTTANITTASLSISGLAANNKVYDGTTTATMNTSGASLTGIAGGDVVNLVTTGASAVFANKNAGTSRAVTASGFTLSGTDAGNYTLIQPNLTANINSLGITVNGLTANNKVYSGTAAATLSTGSASLSGVLGGDAINLISAGAIGAFSNKNVGTNKIVTISGLTLGGTDSGNYTLIQPSATADITTAALIVSGVTASNKVYNGTTSATLNTGSAVLTGVMGSDVVSLISTGATGTFANKSAGTAKTVSTSGFAIGGTDAANYTLTQPAATANITGLVLTISGVTANNRVYNGITSATINTGSALLTGVLGGDAVNLITTGATGTFASKNAGIGKSISTSGFTLGGTDAGNYLLTQPTLTANITTKELTIGGSFNANNKVYDGSTSAIITTNSLTLINKEGIDDVTLNAVAVFVNKDVGTGKIVNLTGSTLAGIDAPNYTLSLAGAPTATATISLSGLTVTGITASSRAYNGTTNAVVNLGSSVLVGVVGSDVVSLISTGASGTFANKNVGNGKVVSISGLTLTGADAWKYILIQPTATANITSSLLTVHGVISSDKVYDGTTTVTLNTSNASVAGVIGSDIVNLVTTAANGTFADKNAGQNKMVTISGIVLGGSDAGNYTFIQPTSTASITQAVLTVSGVIAKNLIYNGTTSTVLNAGAAVLNGVIGTDIVNLVSIGSTGTFSDKNVGKAKPITTSGFSITGPGAANYTLKQPSLSADISPKSLIIRANNLTKPYGTSLTFAGNEITITGLVANDPLPGVTITSPGVSASVSVGTYVISVTNGSDSNYTYSYVNGVLSVIKAVLVASADNKTKYYGYNIPALTITYSGFKNNDDPSVLDVLPTVFTNALNSSSLGTYPITLSGGSDSNYELSLLNGILEIQKAPLIITADDKTKIFREENPPLTIAYNGFVLGQDLSVFSKLPIIETEATANSDAGIYDIIVSGAAAANYNMIYNKGILTINKADQHITFDDLPDGLRMTQEIKLNASASSGLDVSFSLSDPGIGDVNSNILTVKRDGKLIVTANQEGDQNWNPATEVSKSIVTLPTFDNISSLFTPNNDGMNDYWYFPDLEAFGIMKVTVYNRYGQPVYHSDSYKNDWDGTWNGNPLPEASYYYIIKSSTKGYLKGVVNIVR